MRINFLRSTIKSSTTKLKPNSHSIAKSTNAQNSSPVPVRVSPLRCNVDRSRLPIPHTEIPERLSVEELNELLVNPANEVLIKAAFERRSKVLRKGEVYSSANWLRELDPDNLKEMLETVVRLRVSLAGCDLAGCDLAGAKLAYANFSEDGFLRNNYFNTDLAGTNLEGADLRFTNLSKVDATGANLTKADLTGANLKGANLSYSNLTEANLKGADIPNAFLSGANLTEANLSGANLSGANAAFADFTGTDFTQAGLYLADLRNTNLTGANLSGANLISTFLRFSKLAKANLTRANLTGACLTEANLSEAILSKAHAAFADLSGADLSGANLYQTNLENTDLTGANLSGANLPEANLSGATIKGADLSGTYLYQTNLKKADLRKANFDSTELLDWASLRGADLRGATGIEPSDIPPENCVGAIWGSSYPERLDNPASYALDKFLQEEAEPFFVSLQNLETKINPETKIIELPKLSVNGRPLDLPNLEKINSIISSIDQINSLSNDELSKLKDALDQLSFLYSTHKQPENMEIGHYHDYCQTAGNLFTEVRNKIRQQETEQSQAQPLVNPDSLQAEETSQLDEDESDGLGNVPNRNPQPNNNPQGTGGGGEAAVPEAQANTQDTQFQQSATPPINGTEALTDQSSLPPSSSFSKLADQCTLSATTVGDPTNLGTPLTESPENNNPLKDDKIPGINEDVVNVVGRERTQTHDLLGREKVKVGAPASSN